MTSFRLRVEPAVRDHLLLERRLRLQGRCKGYGGRLRQRGHCDRRGQFGACPARSRSRISFHSPIARSASTAITALPSAPATAPISRNDPDRSEQSSEQLYLPSAYPSSPPSPPTTTTIAKAIARATCGGSAESCRGCGACGLVVDTLFTVSPG